MDATITKKERNWIGDLPVIDNPNLLRFPKNYQLWKIIFSIIDFEKWRKSQNKNCLFFDGASRGNPGEERARGVLYSNDGNTKLGTKSKNHEYYLPLLKGCQIAFLLDYREILIFGDSLILINSIIH